MDLEAAHNRNTRADKLTRLSMVVCFLISGGVLLGTLAVAQPDPAPTGIVASSSK